MKWFLVCWLFIGGEWVSGDMVDGWGAYRMDNAIDCYRAADRANMNSDGSLIKFECEGRYG
jgi:hypothetical protein